MGVSDGISSLVEIGRERLFVDRHEEAVERQTVKGSGKRECEAAIREGGKKLKKSRTKDSDGRTEGDNYAYLGTRDRALECRCGSRICRGQALRVPLLVVTCYVCQTYKQPTRGATATWAPSYLPWSVSALMAIVGVASSTAGTAKWGAVTEQRDEGRDLPAVPECSHEYRHSPRGCSAETSQGSPP